MSRERLPMLQEGYHRLQDELRRLKTVDRSAIVKAIEEARAHGDLSENAEYHAAKEKQGWIEARIIELEEKLSRAEVIDPTAINSDTITFGATVTVIDEDDAEVVYQIVGTDEADVKAGRISYTSPMGRALIGRRLKDEVEVKTPSGERYYEISKIAFI